MGVMNKGFVKSFKGHLLDEKRFIMTRLFEGYVKLVDGDLNESVRHLEGANSLLGNDSEVAKVIELTKGGYAHIAKNNLSVIILSGIENSSPPKKFN